MHPRGRGALSLLLALVALLLLASLVPAPPALATHGGSHDPSPSGPDCEWYGSAEHDYHQDVEQDGGYTSEVRELGSGWSGPSDDSTCRGTVQYSYTQHDTSPDGLWWHQHAEGTVSATYEAGWANFGPPGNFAVRFAGAEPVTLVHTNSSGGEPGTQEVPAGTQGGCLVPGAETPAKQASIQAVVVTCSQIQSGSADQSWTATFRMRRRQCDATVDSDGDDLADCTEFALQTEPHNPDTDGDALTDGQEVLGHGTDPRDPDTDDGGIQDGAEVARGTDPLDGTDDAGRELVTLTRAVDPAEHGTLSGCRSSCAGQYERGVTVTLAVTPDPGWRLVRWTGACAGVQPTCSVTMDTDKQAGAVLEPATECNNWAGGFTTREYRLSAYPNLELFRFAPSVSYRFNSRCAEITKAHGSGLIDWGLDTYVLELLGFLVRYDDQNVRFGIPSDKVSLTSHATAGGGRGASALISGDFDVHFEWTALLTRVKFTKAMDAWKGRLARRIETYMKKRFPQPDLLTRDQRIELRRKWIPETQHKIVSQFDKQLERLRGPQFLRRAIRSHVMGVVQDQVKLLENPTDFTSGHHRVRQFSEILAGELVGAAMGIFTNALPNDFSVWSPEIRVTVEPGGHVSYDVGGYSNPFTSIELVPGSEYGNQGDPPPEEPLTQTQRTPTQVAETVVASAAEILRTVGLRSGSTSLRVPAGPGRLTITVSAGGGGGAGASIARRRLLARGTFTSTKAGWREMKLKATRHLKRAGKRPRATITAVYTAPSAAPSTQRAVARVKRLR
jgi:Divergent InlB B-repeat domain